jgi:hypothetical protein
MPEPAAIGVRTGRRSVWNGTRGRSLDEVRAAGKGATKWTRNWAGANSWER